MWNVETFRFFPHGPTNPRNGDLCLSLSKRKWEGGAKHSRAFFDDLLLARGPFIQASVWRWQLLLVKRAIPDIWSKNLSRVRVFLTILHSSDWNLSHSHVLDDSQNAWECFAPLQLLKRFVWDKNSIHLINWPIFRIRAEKIISSRRSLIQAESWRVSIVWINRTSHRSAFVFFCAYLFMFKDLSWLFCIAQHRPNVIFGTPELKMHDGASHHFACTLPPSKNKPEDFSQTTRSKQPAEPQRHDRGPQDWPPTGNAELLFLHIS